MCGIAGLLAPDGERADPDAVRRMSDALAHRGPDGSGLHRDGPCVLGHRRLAIIDLSDAARQPMLNEDGHVAIAVVGEIYNHLELRRGLEGRGHVFRSRSDIEVVAHLWEEHGEATPALLRGMFAIAVWDRARGELMLARDRYGEKSIYWTFGGRGLAFASELPALLELGGVGRELDLAALDAYLALQYVPHPHTIFQGIHKLPPGHLMVVRPGQEPVTRPYATIDHAPRHAGIDAREAAREVRRVVEDAVRVRLMSDVPLGAFLSGGVDSSIVVACMARASSTPVKTFSIGVGDDPELPYARLVAERYRTEHHEELVTPDTVGMLPEIVRSHGEPFADPSAVPTRVLAQMTRKHVTVALSGDGADEAFGGYRRYVWAHVADALRRLPRLARAGAAELLARIPGRRARWLREYGHHLGTDAAARYLRFVCHFSAAEKSALYSADLRERFHRDATAERFAQLLAGSAAPDPLGKLLELDVRTYLPDDILVKVDIASMAHGLEVRAPFVDRHVLELAAGLPSELKVRGLTGKVLLKRAFADAVPAPILRRAKRGFSLPLARWLSGELYGFAREVLLSRAARGRGLFVPRAVEELLERHRRGEDHGDRIWNLLVLELWHREVFDRPARAAAVIAAPRL
jgi:asparagine synthase (glutamine-hydrolysing)